MHIPWKIRMDFPLNHQCFMIMQTQLIPQYEYIPLHPHLAWQFHFIHILYYHYPFREGGRTQIARHNLDVFEGGGPVKCWQAFIFHRALFAIFHFSRSPHSLQDFIYFQKKTRGAFNIVHCIFEKSKNMKKIVWRSANSCRLAENQKCKLEAYRSPIAWYFQYSLHYFYTFFLFYHSHM